MSFHIGLLRRDDREAEGARLLSECRVKNLTEGSNPSLSATVLPPEVSSEEQLANCDRSSDPGSVREKARMECVPRASDRHRSEIDRYDVQCRFRASYDYRAKTSRV